MAGQDHKLTLIFIINGEEFSVETNQNASLVSAVEKALSVSGNTGRRDPQEWELRDSSGVLLNMQQKPRDLSLQSGAKLFLSLGVGAGGGRLSTCA